MDKEETALIETEVKGNLNPYSSIKSFEQCQRIAKMLSESDLVPIEYRRNVANCMIAVELAHRISMGAFQVMQNLNIIHGRPSWSSSFIIACVNGCGQFSRLKFKLTGQDDDRGCVAYATLLDDGELCESPRVTIEMAKKEGWYSRISQKTGRETSKWPTMPEVMLRYRAAAFFGRLYVPEMMAGLKSIEEAEELQPAHIERDITNEGMTVHATTQNEPETVKELAKEEPKEEPKMAEEPKEDPDPKQTQEVETTTTRKRTTKKKQEEIPTEATPLKLGEADTKPADPKPETKAKAPARSDDDDFGELFEDN